MKLITFQENLPKFKDTKFKKIFIFMIILS